MPIQIFCPPSGTLQLNATINAAYQGTSGRSTNLNSYLGTLYYVTGDPAPHNFPTSSLDMANFYNTGPIFDTGNGSGGK